MAHKAGQPVEQRYRESALSQDRVLVHRQIVAHYSKIFEILEPEAS
jgi:hypothetical protein